MDRPDADQIELAHVDSRVKLTVSSNHVIALLTGLKERGFEALGQDAPLFGVGDFPTIYYVNFEMPLERLADEIRIYLQARSIAFTERRDESGILTFTDFAPLLSPD